MGSTQDLKQYDYEYVTKMASYGVSPLTIARIIGVSHTILYKNKKLSRAYFKGRKEVVERITSRLMEKALLPDVESKFLLSFAKSIGAIRDYHGSCEVSGKSYEEQTKELDEALERGDISLEKYEKMNNIITKRFSEVEAAKKLAEIKEMLLKGADTVSVMKKIVETDEGTSTEGD